MLGKTEGKQQSMKWLDSITDSRDTNLSKLWETVKDRGAWCLSDTAYGVTKSRARLRDWTTVAAFYSEFCFFASGGQSIGASASVLPMNIQD